MSTKESVDFNFLCSNISIKEFFEKWGVYVEYKDDGKGYGEKFVVFPDKNKLIWRGESSYKSIINFVADYEGISLYEAGLKIKHFFFPKAEPAKKEFKAPTLEYHPYLAEQGISEETAKLYNVGLATSGMFKGKIVFFMGEHWLSFNPKAEPDKQWIPPKGFIWDCLFNAHDSQETFLTVSPFLALQYLERKVNACATVRLNPTRQQLAIIKEKYRIVTVRHPSPQNIVMSLADTCHVKFIV